MHIIVCLMRVEAVVCRVLKVHLVRVGAVFDGG